jgi:hypothetical protein
LKRKHEAALNDKNKTRVREVDVANDSKQHDTNTLQRSLIEDAREESEQARGNVKVPQRLQQEQFVKNNRNNKVGRRNIFENMLASNNNRGASIFERGGNRSMQFDDDFAEFDNYDNNRGLGGFSMSDGMGDEFEQNFMRGLRRLTGKRQNNKNNEGSIIYYLLIEYNFQ